MDAFDVFKIMHRQQSDADRRRRSAIEQQWKQFGEIREKDLFLRIGFSSQEFFDDLLANHPARELADKVDNVDRAFDILSRSRAAFVDIAGKFHARVVHNLHQDKDREPALGEATKEIYTYSCAASSLVQAYRHLVSGNAEFKNRYDALRAQLFDGKKILKFLSDLRNSNNHIHILEASPHYTITTRFEGKPEVKSGISFNRDRITRDDGWTAESKSFAANRENLEVIDLIDEHFRLVSEFKTIVLHRTGINSDKGFRDLARISHARKLIGQKAWLSVVLDNATKKKLNPYEYLHQWFNEVELENIYSFSDHTREQVEYIISLRDTFGFCDREMREMLYILFSVPLDQLPQQPRTKPRVDF